MTRHLRIFNRAGDLLADLMDVTGTTVTAPGVLVVNVFPVTPIAPELYAYAPGHWGHVEELPRDTRPESAATDPAGAEPEPVPSSPGTGPCGHPGHPTTSHHCETQGVPVVYPDLNDLGDAARVHHAMSILCICADLRCPVVINPPSTNERRFWRKRQVRGTAAEGVGGPAPEPFMQCVEEVGHDTSDTRHHWESGVWLYGPGNHHPSCPRYPATYNRPPEEAAPDAPQGVSGSAHVPTADLSADQTVRFDDTTLVRTGFVAQLATMEEQRTAELEEAGYYWGRGDSDSGPVIRSEPYNVAQREGWRVCAIYAPGYSDRSVWCTEPVGHPEDVACSMTLPGGDVVRW